MLTLVMTFTSTAAGLVVRLVGFGAHAAQDEPAGSYDEQNKRADLNNRVPHGLEPLSFLGRVLVLVRGAVVGCVHTAPDGNGGSAEQKRNGQNLENGFDHGSNVPEAENALLSEYLGAHTAVCNSLRGIGALKGLFASLAMGGRQEDAQCKPSSTNFRPAALCTAAVARLLGLRQAFLFRWSWLDWSSCLSVATASWTRHLRLRRSTPTSDASPRSPKFQPFEWDGCQC